MKIQSWQCTAVKFSKVHLPRAGAASLTVTATAVASPSKAYVMLIDGEVAWKPTSYDSRHKLLKHGMKSRVPDPTFPLFFLIFSSSLHNRRFMKAKCVERSIPHSARNAGRRRHLAWLLKRLLCRLFSRNDNASHKFFSLLSRTPLLCPKTIL